MLDALVRRDAAARSASASVLETPEAFSQRLTANERRLTGLDVLTAAELARLNGLIARHGTASLVRALLAPPTYLTRVTPSEVIETREQRRIHGTFSLGFGWGSGGYSEQTGAMLLHLDDPAGRYSISVGYAQTRIKGPGFPGPYREDLPPLLP